MSSGFFVREEDHSFTSYLTGEFVEVFGSAELERQKAAEAARALTMAMREYGFGEEIPSNLLTLMIARILWTLNHRDEAQEYIVSHLGAGEHPDLYLTLLDRSDFDIRTWQMLDSKILTRQTWDSLNESSVWVLDLGALSHDSSLCYELAIYTVLKGLTSQLEAYGDERDGQFYVALRGYTPVSESITARDIKDYCEKVLSRIQVQRKWAYTPTVGFTDLP
jgi:hypothetical protein